MKKTAKILSVIVIISILGVVAVSKAVTPLDSAKPIDKPGLPNFYQVSEFLYRGAQPTSEGFQQLDKMGIKTVISLRHFHSDKELIKGLSLQYEPIPFNTWNPKEEYVVKFIDIVKDKNNHPIFVHCQHGADRTGTMIAIYRIVFEDWDTEKAIKEMTEGPFGYHSIWTHLPPYIRSLDIEKYKKMIEDK